MATKNQIDSSLSGVTGSGNLVGANSPTLVTPNLGTPASGTLTNCTGLPVAGGGTGVASTTAYAVLCGGTSSTAALQSIAGLGTAGQVLTSNGAGALPTFEDATGGGGGGEVVDDTSPQLGGDLDVNGHLITSAAAGDVQIQPHTSGALLIGGNTTAPTEMRFLEDSDNGSNYTAIKAASSIASNATFTLPSEDGTDGQFLKTNGSGVLAFATPAGAGDVLGPVSSTDNALVRWDGAGGDTVQDSAIIIDDSNNITGVVGLTASDHLTVGGNATAAGYIELLEDTDNGSNKLTIKPPQSISSNKIATFPDATGTVCYDVGSSNIVTVGTIATGTWQATTLATGYGGTGVTSVTTAPTASAFAGWDANSNLSADNFISGYTTTATAAGTTTLTVDSTYQQYFTGATTQTVTLPVTSTLVLGQQFFIENLSSGVVTVQSSGANTLQAMAANTTLLVTCVSTAGTGTASWTWLYGKTDTVSSGSGDVVGPASAADTNIALFDGTTGKLLKRQVNCTINSSGNMFISGYGNFTSQNVKIHAGLSSASASSCAVGQSCMQSGQSGATQNTCMGADTASALSTGDGITAIGYRAHNTITTNSNGTAIGAAALQNATGGDNTAVGNGCLSQVSSGTTNVGLGLNAGVSGATDAVSLTTGTGNTLLGYRASVTVNSSVDCIAIGRDAVAVKASGATSSDSGPGIAIGSAAAPVGFRGDASIYPITGGSNSLAGFWKVKINGTKYHIPLGTDAISTLTPATVEVTDTSATMAINTTYIANNAGLVTLTLPATAAVGDRISVAGKGAGGWKIAQNASQVIHFGSTDTTTGTGGSLASTNRYDSLEVICITTNTDFVVLGAPQGTLTVV